METEIPKTVEVEQTRIACDGDGGVLGHPKIYLEIGEDEFVECPYCGRRFVLKMGAKTR